MLELKNISRVYKMGDTVLYALKDVSLTIEQGDFVSIMGPSGSGKSTLMNVLGLLDQSTSGTYRIQGREVSRLNEQEMALLRRKTIGFIFQQFNLLPRMTATENTFLPLLYSKPGASDERARHLLEKVGLGSRLKHKTNELSGGQQQRVAIARALINSPSVLFADEPTGNLDSASEAEIMRILKDLNSQGITIVMVTHEEEIGAQAKRRIRMRDGKILSDERLRPIEDAQVSLASKKEPENSKNETLLQIWGHLQQGMHTLWSNKVRTSLSMLGILIGVAAVIAMLAIGKGAQQQIEQQLSSLGSNLLILRPGGTRVGGVAQEARVTRLTTDDVRALRSEIPSVRNASATVSGRAQISYRNKNWNTQITGVEPQYERMRASEPQRGRFFTDTESQMRARVAVLGMTVVRELFGTEDPLGEMIKINRINFQVIGVLPAKGSAGWRDQDDVILIPVQTAMRRLFGKDYVDTIEIEVEETAANETTEESILTLMETRHRTAVSQGEEPFRVQNMADIQEALTSSSRTMSLLLSSIAAISLLVGGIGIMNIMLVSVTERTREIGLRKAVGARPQDILFQFLIESVIISVLGGVCGILVGWSVSQAVSTFVGWTTSIAPSSVMIAFVFSLSVGLIFGIYPAKRASALNPIEALRHE